MVPVNYLAIIVSAVLMMVIGYVWYGPLFGKRWATLMGLSPEARVRLNLMKVAGATLLGGLAKALSESVEDELGDFVEGEAVEE